MREVAVHDNDRVDAAAGEPPSSLGQMAAQLTGLHKPPTQPLPAVEYLSVTEAAKRTKVHRTRLMQLIRANRIPGAWMPAGEWLLPANFVVLPPTRLPSRGMTKLATRRTA